MTTRQQMFDRERDRVLENNNQEIPVPFAEREYIDSKRAQRILGCGWGTVSRLINKGLIEVVEYRSSRSRKVRYRSIVGFCDHLRAHYLIPDRRPALASPLFRHKDEDLLPFRLHDTISSVEALTAMGVVDRRIISRLVEEGRFEAYRLEVGGNWRISRPSFAAYLRKCQTRPDSAAFPLRRSGVTEDCTL